METAVAKHTSVEPDIDACEHCGARLTGRYCAECGQDALGAVVPLRKMLTRGLADLLALDLRYPRTIKALSIPGRLTALYLSGHRVPFVPPLRLALTSSLLLFAALALRVPGVEAVTTDTGLLEDLSLLAREHAMGFALAQLLALPLFAVLLWLGFKRFRRFYVSHLTFAFHYHAAVSLAACGVVLLSFLIPEEVLLWGILVLLVGLIGPYLLVALRRTYEVTWLRALAFWPVGSVGYLVLNVLIFLIVLGVSVGLGGP